MRRAHWSIFTLGLLAIVFLLAPLPSTAQSSGISQVISRSALAGNDFIDWAQLGPPTPDGCQGGPAVISNGGLLATVTVAGPNQAFPSGQACLTSTMNSPAG